MSGRWWIVGGGLLAALAVLAGAFGAHELKQRVDAGAMTDKKLVVYETAARYQMFHSVGLVLVGLSAVAGSKPGRKLWAPHLAGCCFVLGIICFCGWLYADALLAATPPLPLLAPAGGLLFMIGWLLLAASGWKVAERGT